jgi:hypothetical protein
MTFKQADTIEPETDTGSMDRSMNQLITHCCLLGSAFGRPIRHFSPHKFAEQYAET